MSASQLPSKYRWFSTGNLPRNAGFQPASPVVTLVFQPANPLLRPYTPTKKSALQTSLAVPLVFEPAIPLPRPTCRLESQRYKHPRKNWPLCFGISVLQP